MNLFDLTGKHAVVTGASRGIGKAIAEALMEHGATVFLVASPKSKQDLDAWSDKRIAGRISIDLTEKGAAAKVLSAAIGAMKRVDILVNAAGIAIDNLFLRISEDEWDKQMNINLKAPWLLTQAFVKHMMSHQWGRVISISSVIGHTGNAGQSVYAATKAGLFGLTRSLAQEVAKKNITLNTISPGFIQTDMTDQIVKNPKIMERILPKIPMSYIGKPEDVTSSVIYLASESARYITGIDILVAGGMLMQ